MMGRSLIVGLPVGQNGIGPWRITEFHGQLPAVPAPDASFTIIVFPKPEHPKTSQAAGAAAHADAAMACLIEGPRRSYHHHAAESRRLAEKAGARELILQARLLQTVDVKIQNRWAYLASRARTAGRAQLRADACALAAVLAQRTHDPGGAAQAMLQLHAELGRSRCDGLRPWAEALEEWLAVEETTQI